MIGVADARRIIIEIVEVLLTIGGIVAAVAVAYLYWRATPDSHWYTAVVAALLGLASGLGSWFLAALLGLAVEIADSLRTLVAIEQKGKA